VRVGEGLFGPNRHSLDIGSFLSLPTLCRARDSETRFAGDDRRWKIQILLLSTSWAGVLQEKFPAAPNVSDYE